MLIDWFTVGAQLVNFLILVWLMKHFLYKPILAAIDGREKLIAKELADAAGKKAEADQSRDQFERKNEEFEKQRAANLDKATVAAKAEGDKLLDQARKAADDLRLKRMESLRNEANDLCQKIRDKVQQEVFEIARKTLKDLSNTNLEDQMCEIFALRLREIDATTKETLGTAIRKETTSLIRSAFELSAQQKANLQKAVNETFSAAVPLRYEIAPQLVSGIELLAGGQKVVWNIDDYLCTIKDGLDKLLATADSDLSTGTHAVQKTTSEKAA